MACAIGLQADVSYDVTLTRNSFTPFGIDAAVPNAEDGVYDIRPDLYDAPMGKSKPSLILHLMIKGNKLSVVGDKTWKIIDLDARSLTSIDKNHRAYSVETLDAAYAREAENANYGFGTNLHFEVVANKTGKTRQEGGKTLEEYDIVTIARPFGKPRVKQSIRCWAMGGAPSSELQEFRKKWSATTRMAFPDTTMASPSDVSANGLALRKMDELGAWVPSFVWESRPVENALTSKPGYDAGSAEVRPVNDQSGNPNLAAFSQIVEIKTELSPIDLDLISEAIFQVPSGFKQAKNPLPLD